MSKHSYHLFCRVPPRRAGILILLTTLVLVLYSYLSPSNYARESEDPTIRRYKDHELHSYKSDTSNKTDAVLSGVRIKTNNPIRKTVPPPHVTVPYEDKSLIYKKTEAPKVQKNPHKGNYQYRALWITHIRSDYGVDDTNDQEPSAGFAEEAINFMVPLCRMLRGGFGWQEEGKGSRDWEKGRIWKELNSHDKELLLECYETGKSFIREVGSMEETDIIYIAMIQFAPYDLGKIRSSYPELSRFNYRISRAMFETTALPYQWDRMINKHVDEVWVPSSFASEVFAKSGVFISIRVIGEGFDTVFLDAAEAVNKRQELCEVQCQPDDYIFLSVSKFEDRKGFDHLFEAYSSEFKTHENVCLAVRANGLEDIQLPTESGVLRTCVIPRQSTENYRDIYKSADAFVLATHGEVTTKNTTGLE